MTTTEEQLLERLRQGDRSAFDAVYGRYADRIHGFLLRLCRDPVVADDLAQDTWMAFARSSGAMREGSDLAAYLFTIARNQARSHRRWSLLDLLRLAVPEADGDSADEAPGLERRIDAARAAEHLEQALSALEPNHREVILLVCVEGFEPTKAAEILGLPPPTLRKRLSRARLALSTELDRASLRRASAPAHADTP